MKTENRNLGFLGETLALEYLLDKGYELVQKNFSTKFGEIDLIVKDKDVLVFVEVKTKKGLDWGSPEEMFGVRKRQKVMNMAKVYLKGQETKCRIDMVAIVLNEDNSPNRISHYENV